MKKLLYLFSFIVPLSTLISLTSTGGWTYTAVIVNFLIIPIIELGSPAKLNFDSRVYTKYFDFLLYSMVIFQISLVTLFCIKISNVSFSIFEYIGLILSMGVSCGALGINVAHELGHRTNSFDQLFAKILLSTSLYTHFFIEHNRGHHKLAATELDSASAKYNQPIYTFWLKSIIGNLKTAYRIDKKNFLKWKTIELILVLLMAYIFSVIAALSFCLSALIGILLLESVNYVEHYGLRRKLQKSGRYEKFGQNHAWNSDHVISRILLFNLPRHSDHHIYSNKKYPQLENNLTSGPQLPTGYPGMVLLAMIPPLWFKVMNQRLKSYL